MSIIKLLAFLDVSGNGLALQFNFWASEECVSRKMKWGFGLCGLIEHSLQQHSTTCMKVVFSSP